MNEKDYYEMQESVAIGQAIGLCVRAILSDNSAQTLGQLQRSAYKYTAAGVSVGFMLHDGSYLWNGDPRAHDPAMIDNVADICVSSIVEGSDAEVAPVWVGIMDIVNGANEDVAAEAVYRYSKIVADVDAHACDLWHEANAGGDDDDDAIDTYHAWGCEGDNT